MAKFETKLKAIYSQAEVEILQKMEEFTEKFKAKDAIHRRELADGKITQEDYDNWLRGQVFQGKRWTAKREEIARVLYNANSVAIGKVNDEKKRVFAFNSNYQAYELEHTGGVNFGFDLYDATTVERLIRDEPTLLPMKKMDPTKDIPWNMRNITREVTQGIIQGESLQAIANRIARETGSTNQYAMMRSARTAMTGAQNSGRNVRLREARDKGINVMKQWMATLDGRTRDSHRDMDGEKIRVGDKWHHYKFSNGCEYPGDPQGPPREVYNCRCTLVGDLVDYPAEYERYDNIDGKPIANMTYREWEKAKKSGVALDPVFVVNSFQSMLGLAKSVDEVNTLMNSQGWWRKKPYGMLNEADLTGCDLDSAKSIAAAYQQVFEKYPQLIGRFDAPDAHPKEMSARTYAWCFIKNSGHVQVNPAMYSDWSALQASYDRTVRRGFHPFGTTAESIVTHEIGHAIDGLLAREGILGGVAANGSYRYASSTLRSTIMKRAAEKNPELARYWNAKDWTGKADKFWQAQAIDEFVSGYATENPQEWFAECFAEYITSANPRIVATEFGKELEKLLARLAEQ